MKTTELPLIAHKHAPQGEMPKESGRCLLVFLCSKVLNDPQPARRNQLKAIQADCPPPLATCTYDLNGNRTLKTLENGSTTSYDCVIASKLIRMKQSEYAIP